MIDKRIKWAVRIGVAAILLMAAMVAWGYLQGTDASAAVPDFRIIDIREHDGQLLVEVEHFRADGSFDYFENYLWQGREGGKFPRVTNADGFLLLWNGAVAPLDVKGEQHLPPNAKWMRATSPYLDTDSILSVIQRIHNKRRHWTEADWPGGKKGGQSRLTEPPISHSQRDQDGIDTLLTKLGGLVDKAYLTEDSGILLAYGGDLPGINRGLGQVEFGTVSTFFPDAHVESTSVDGWARRLASGGEDFGTLRAGSGTQSNDTAGSIPVVVAAHDTTSDKFINIARGILLFDTSSLDDGATISAADFVFVATLNSVRNEFDGDGAVSLITSTPASNVAVASADYAQLGTTKQASDQLLSGITDDDATATTMALNATGKSSIDKTGITKFGLRISNDNDNGVPTWTGGEAYVVAIASAEEVLSGDRRPKLVVTHATISAAITGTIGDGATEQEVRDGAGTIIITLTADTWVAAGATFDAQRQAIISGLDAAESESNGWNAQVRDQMGVTSVVRTNSTVATITVSAAAVSAYRIDANEVITMTVPNASLVSSSSDITATPTIAITAAAESAAITGTLGGSGGTPAEIVAGGETVILTLTNTKWVITGEFDAQRQAILDGLVADLSDQNGWNSQAFAVTDVARTSDTVVTITLTAEADYAIPSSETITTTPPASAMVFGESLTGSPTFVITPVFQPSGTRVSAAIDLSSVTDVAYCAIGWEATTPTNTTVTIETSVDGGANYSSATNGNCPTGLTVGGSLATITDFRVRVTFTTSVTGSTPLITALGLIVEDETGQDLYYQLNTTPSATLTDRSSQSHTGTMSFPVAPSGILNSADPLESTEPALTTQQALRSQEVTSEVTGAATSPNIFSQDVGFEGLPGQGVVNMISEAGDGLPKRFVWFIFLGLFTIGIGMVVLMLTGELLIAAVAMAVAMGIEGAIGGGLLPLWTLYTYIPMVATYLLFRRGFPI